MDGENNGKPLLKWMIWGKPTIFRNIHICVCFSGWKDASKDTGYTTNWSQNLVAFDLWSSHSRHRLRQGKQQFSAPQTTEPRDRINLELEMYIKVKSNQSQDALLVWMHNFKRISCLFISCIWVAQRLAANGLQFQAILVAEPIGLKHPPTVILGLNIAQLRQWYFLGMMTSSWCWVVYCSRHLIPENEVFGCFPIH